MKTKHEAVVRSSKHSDAKHSDTKHSDAKHSGAKANTASAESGASSDSDDGISLDFSGVKGFFKKVDLDQVVMWGFILFCMALVLSVRMLPLDLPVTDDWAANSITQNVRSQVAQQVDQQFPALPEANRNTLIDKRTTEIIAQNKDQFATTQTQLSGQFKSFLRYTGDDGKEYTYLGDLDSYFWLRYTRNVLRHGNTCDAVVDGKCRDMHLLAPVGGDGSFNPSLHVFAILGVYKVMTLFDAGYPLPAASYLVPVIVGILAVIPAFFIGRKLAGNVGGLFTAILVGVHPLYLSRSIGSDYDGWQLMLSLFIMWMVIEAVEAKHLKSRIVYSVLAGLFVGIFAATWDAWWFIYLIVFFGLFGYLLYSFVASVLRTRAVSSTFENQELRMIAVIFAVFYIASGIFVMTAWSFSSSQSVVDYVKIPLAALSSGANLDRAVVADYWPNVLTTVAELNKASLSDAVSSMGGRLFFFISLVGMLLLLLPRDKRWHWEHYALLFTGGLIGLYLINGTGFTKLSALGLLVLPLALILLRYLFQEDQGVDIPVALIVLVWFLATLYATYSGVRFILLMIPAFAIGFGVVAGRVHSWVSDYLHQETGWHKYLTNSIVFVVIALLLIQPVKAGQQTARGFIPSIDDSWWDTLVKINKESAPDAIINSWWDFGHWFKYIADRRVSADGTTQHTHVPHWLGVSLVTPDEHEAIGVLRMLNCGSDAYPSELGKYGAYGKVNAHVNDSIKAEHMVRELVLLDKTQARDYLAKQGFTTLEQDDVLNSTHCASPEDYFITSGDMVGKAGVWAHFGLWDFQKAYVAQKSRFMPETQAVADLEQRFGYTQAEATKLFDDARGLTSEGAINAFAAPWPGYITSNWMSCSSEANGTVLFCPLGISVSQQGNAYQAIDSFTFNVSSPNASRLTYAVYQNGQRVSVVANITPGLLRVAYEDAPVDVLFTSATSNSGIGVLLDVPNKRILLADPLLVKSMFTELFYLDGRYSDHFKKFDDRTGFSGSRVITWKIDWSGSQRQTAQSQVDQRQTNTTAQIQQRQQGRANTTEQRQVSATENVTRNATT